MSMILDGSNGLTTPGVVNTAGETIATTLSVTGVTTLTGTLSAANNVTIYDATLNTPRVLSLNSNRTSSGVLGTIRFGNAQFNNNEASIVSESDGAIDAARLMFSTTPTSGSITERMRITSTGLLQFNSGYGSVATAYGCRAWVNFNGTGTVAIRASGNVSSITDNGTGDYTVNFTTAMVDANYSSVASCSPAAGPAQKVVVMNFSGTLNTIVAPTTSACRFGTSALAAASDVEYVDFSVFR